jgi:AraC family transcriptional regulator
MPMTAVFTNVEAESLPQFLNDVSTNDTWQGFEIKKYALKPSRVSERTMLDHTVQFNIGSPLKVSWKSLGKWNSALCNTGNIVALSSPGEVEEVQWETEFHGLDINFHPKFIDQLVEKENFKFKEQRNINDPLLNDLALKLSTEALKAQLVERLYVESLAVTCAIHLATTYSMGDKKVFAPKGKLSSFQLKNAIEYIRSYIHGIVSLEGIAASAHLSVFHFSRLFKNTVGVSPYQFVLHLKIEYAKRLIKQKLAVGDIAYSLGFTDSAHFCNAFKKITGQSPLQFSVLSKW